MDSNTGFGMRMTIKGIRAKFSSVKDVSTETLAKWSETGSAAENRHIVLLDCREPEEYDVSHLDGARRVDWQKANPQELLDALPSDKPSMVVCYCSVGYRSSSVAQKLQQCMASGQGCSKDVQVYNLEGSIFKWANEGRPMISTAGQSTPLCHPYNSVWGKLLRSELRSKGSLGDQE